MFKHYVLDPHRDLYCDKSVDGLEQTDFLYYDKDGFELNVAEQKYYAVSGYKTSSILNHQCWQDRWFDIEHDTLMLDHCMILHRCGYKDAAREQLQYMSSQFPRAQLLLQTKPKWGYDFALDAIAPTGEVYEVLHVEQDDVDYESFMSKKQLFERVVVSTDWVDVATRVWQQRGQWIGLRGFEQNNWKSRMILGWDKAESIEKCV